jgi:uncharacterized membrane protein
VPIRKSGAQVNLPAGVDEKAVTVKCYTGAAGSTAQDCLGRAEGMSASFVANGPLTVVVGWNKGVVATLLPKELGFFTRNSALLPFVIPILVLIGLIALWNKNGRDPKGRGTLMVQYDPPKGMTPAEVAGLCNEVVVTKDISATIVHLAVRGYLQIAEVEKKGILKNSTDYEFRRTKEYASDETLAPFERRIMSDLFGDSVITRVSDIAENHTFYQELQSIGTEILGKLVSDGHFPADPAKVRGGYYGIGALIVFSLFFFRGFEDAFSGSMAGNLVLAAGISAMLFIFFAHLMPRRTPQGVAAYEHALGFKDYLSTAEKYRLQWQEKEKIFETFLPYAMIFGVVEKWSKAFEGMQMPPPQWYQGSSVGGAFNSMAFYGAINSMNGAMTTAMASRPASSSGGSGFSGGSSGGGGGGGGGGSW